MENNVSELMHNMTEELISVRRVKIAIPRRVPAPAKILISGQGL